MWQNEGFETLSGAICIAVQQLITIMMRSFNMVQSNILALWDILLIVSIPCGYGDIITIVTLPPKFVTQGNICQVKSKITYTIMAHFDWLCSAWYNTNTG